MIVPSKAGRKAKLLSRNNIHESGRSFAIKPSEQILAKVVLHRFHSMLEKIIRLVVPLVVWTFHSSNRIVKGI